MRDVPRLQPFQVSVTYVSLTSLREAFVTEKLSQRLKFIGNTNATVGVSSSFSVMRSPRGVSGLRLTRFRAVRNETQARDNQLRPSPWQPDNRRSRLRRPGLVRPPPVRLLHRSVRWQLHCCRGGRMRLQQIDAATRALRPTSS